MWLQDFYATKTQRLKINIICVFVPFVAKKVMLFLKLSLLKYRCKKDLSLYTPRRRTFIRIN